MKMKMNSIKKVLFVGVIFILAGFLTSCNEKGASQEEEVFSIAIYKGDSPLNLHDSEDVDNPVFTAEDVTDRDAAYVADPFMVKEGDKWYMFFEIKLTESPTNLPFHGDIGYATSEDGLNWEYQQVCLDEPFHLSYPNVFKWEGEYYMIPETFRANHVRLYKAVDFPDKWKYEKHLISGNCADNTIFKHNGKWWLFSETASRGSMIVDTSEGGRGIDARLSLFVADSPKGPWCEHYQNPIVYNNPNIARPAGNVIKYENKLYRLAQDCYPEYGLAVKAFEIEKLTPTIYREKPYPRNPVIESGDEEWNQEGMHHIDAHRYDAESWIAVVDGWYWRKK